MSNTNYGPPPPPPQPQSPYAQPAHYPPQQATYGLPPQIPQPPQRSGRKSRTGLIIGVVIAAVILLLSAIGVFTYFVLSAGSEAPVGADATAVSVGKWDLEVTKPVASWERIQQIDDSAQPPAAGMDYYSVKVTGTHDYGEDVDPFYGLQLIFIAIDGEPFTDENCGLLPDDVRAVDEIAPGEPFSGRFCSITPTDVEGDWYLIDYDNPLDRAVVGSR